MDVYDWGVVYTVQCLCQAKKGADTWRDDDCCMPVFVSTNIQFMANGVATVSI